MIVIEMNRESKKPEMRVDLTDYEARLRREHGSYTESQIRSILADTEVKLKNDLWLRSFLE